MAAVVGLGGCNTGGDRRDQLRALALDAPAGSVVDRVVLTGAGGEWLDFMAVHHGRAESIRIGPLESVGGGPKAPKKLSGRIYRVVDIPADTNRAGYLRLHGGSGSTRELPRALVPLGPAGTTFRLPRSTGETAVKLWVDLELPRGLPRGRWQSEIQVVGQNGRIAAKLPMEIRSHGFDLPLQRTLVISAPLQWEQLTALWPDAYRGAAPTLLSRSDPRSSAAIAVLDSMVKEAQANRVQVTVPALGPIVKWPAGRAPEADWHDFDSLVRPWLSGEGFADGVGLRDWPLPSIPGAQNYSRQARDEFWQAVLSHFDSDGSLDRSMVLLDESVIEESQLRASEGALGPDERLRLSQEAGRIARVYGAGRIALPLESDEVRFTGPEHPDMFPPQDAHRLIIRAEGLVTGQASRPWPAGLPEPQRYLQLAGPAPAPMPGPGASEADVRLWGWLAFLRGATHLAAEHALPPSLERSPVDPTELVWFYPGELFGAPEPVPTVQLKWLRRAQQDFEYLAAASQRREEAYARVIARALVRPVRVESGGRVDPVLPLLAGTSDPGLWREGLLLVADKVALADEAVRAQLPQRFETDHINRTTTWLAPRERPIPLVTGTSWSVSGGEGPDARLVLRLDSAIYNPSDASPEGMSISFAEMPGGEPPRSAVWQDPGTVRIPAVATYEVGRAALTTSANVEALALVFPTFQQGPMRLAVRDEYTGAASVVSAVAPAMVVDERPQPPVVDGRLSEWAGNEAIIDGRMLLMHSRPALQSGEVQRAPKPAQAFVGWTAEGLHIAFRLEEAQRRTDQLQATRNFVDTEYQRVWGEDVCEVLIQPMWTRNGDAVDGPLLHVVCKPDGAFVRRRTDRRTAAQPWQNFESGMRFAATVDDSGVWRGEVTLPWSALRDQVTEQQLGDRGREARPALLRFNLSHHEGESGISASWAGPVDFGADEHFTGALILRSPAR